MPDWSIKIVLATSPTPDVPAAFLPDLMGATPGTPLTAQVDDLVTWNNTTNQDHWPWPVDASNTPLPDNEVSTTFGNYLSDRIPAGASSSPSYDVLMPKTTLPDGTGVISYCCKLHPKILGQIIVTPIPTV